MMLVSVDEEVLEGIETERKWRNHINNSTLQVLHKEKQSLQKKLEIAVKALEEISKLPVRVCCDNTAQEALAKIKEIKEC